MNNLSLKNLSIIVVVASLVSNFVFAHNKEVSLVVPNAEASKLSFSQLVTDYDIDKSNTLSKSELSSNEILIKSFEKLDSNSDSELNEAELKQFLENKKKSLL